MIGSRSSLYAVRYINLITFFWGLVHLQNEIFLDKKTCEIEGRIIFQFFPQGAYKRHQAILKGEVLNIPNTDSLDGLFSAGLRFLQARQYDSGRLATARYEMLHLSSEDFHFEDLAAKEFSVPSHLHELFCWIHDYDPLDLLGKPWVRYHLELQLLQDALKTARMERRK